MKTIALPWSTALKIAWRDLRSAWVKFLFVVAAVALGVASLSGVRSFSVMVERTLLRQARTIMAADLSARTFRTYTPAEIVQLDALPGVHHTLETETVSMAETPTARDPLLVSLKAVDPAQYPYYGSVQLASGRPLAAVLTRQTAVVSQEFLLRMHASLGTMMHLGNSDFRIADVILTEPDRISSSFGIGPRVMIDQAAIPASGLVRVGSRASERLLFRLPEDAAAKGSMTITALRKRVEAILPDAQITDYREANPALADGVHHAAAMLTLISLVTLVLSAIGVGMAMHAHLRQRMDSIAIMKALGARSGGVLRIFLAQTLLLGAAGSLLGIGVSVLVTRGFAAMLQRLVTLPLAANLALSSAFIGFAAGVLTTFLFTLPPLFEIRSVRPLGILRRRVEPAQTAAWRILPLREPVQIATIAIILIGLAGIAMFLTQSTMVGGWFAAALALVLVVLGLASAGMLAALRSLLRRHSLRIAPPVRHGLASLYRPGNQSAAVLSTLGVGVMMVASVYAMQHAIIHDLDGPETVNAPNVFLIDISPEELAGVTQLLHRQTGITGNFETIPLVHARIEAINGVPASQLHIKHYPERRLRSATLTWAGPLPPGEEVIAGHWWKGGNPRAQLAVSDYTAKVLHVHVGATMTFHAAGQTLLLPVTAIYRSDGEHLYARSQFVVPPNLLTHAAVIWYGGFHAASERIPAIERALYAAYPSVTLINIADVERVIRKAVDQIATLLRFLAAFTILAGCIILASSITATRFERVREVAILKSLGALRRQIVTALSMEFALLGAIAGFCGVCFAVGLSAILLHKMDVPFRPGWPVMFAAVFLTGILAIASGWMASLRVLNQRPLAVLRDE
jgi:putative ABC transport system permease protein